MKDPNSFRRPSGFIFFQDNKVLELLARLTKNNLILKQKKKSILLLQRNLFE
tara:strand:- start:561 stop:716 length:156 start_codon:yes stop_codon:yes gene_type:complete